MQPCVVVVFSVMMLNYSGLTVNSELSLDETLVLK